ncbi:MULTISPECIES: GNAT family N-acetyltransferase [unclassified Bacillus (in: firmicutes)]|uniref:GNAT family N-acetyltransferase n=1 Tax=unclassified Bacillus (in: firmicutes) TaxID=185979 RepID=UPI0008EDA48E|nr:MULTISPECIES: GNAT family N-acetyltransferase [unclassified Bacillus (in: firmicutes)]SFB13844.1 putative acetyltransferase [Bacillus sp. UNCCL13]SFQ89898.1 putative acetyltransferase [Bacillus sp. cl95]
MNLIDKKEISIELITQDQVEEARYLVLEGLKERFGFLDDSYNPDLKDIVGHYIDKGNVFLIGKLDSVIVCTGALTIESQTVGRIERMSVKKDYRGKGFARTMLSELETYAKTKGIAKVILETNNEWKSAIDLYQSQGFSLYLIDERSSHFEKSI